jgi:hypothetical protein
MVDTVAKFRWETFKSGAKEKQSKESINGEIQDNNIGPEGKGSFRTIGVRVSEPAGLIARVSCMYVNEAQELKEGPWVDDGGQSPPGGVANPRYIQALKMQLAGAHADEYRVYYRAKVVKTRADNPRVQEKPPEDYFSGVAIGGKPGKWAGTLALEADFFTWIYELTVLIIPNTDA